MNTSKVRSLLLARPSFLEGIARLFDFGNTLSQYYFNEPDVLTPQEADALAIYSDWQAVGDDMREVMMEYSNSEEFQKALYEFLNNQNK